MESKQFVPDCESLLALMDRDENNQINIKKAFEYVRLQYVNKKRITDTFFEIGGENEKYTLMQFAAKNGKHQFVMELLNLNVNPNFPMNIDEEKDNRKSRIFNRLISVNNLSEMKKNFKPNCKSAPVLLAAEYGFYQVIKVFKYNLSEYYFTYVVTTHYKSLFLSNDVYFYLSSQ